MHAGATCDSTLTPRIVSRRHPLDELMLVQESLVDGGFSQLGSVCVSRCADDVGPVDAVVCLQAGQLDATQCIRSVLQVLHAVSHLPSPHSLLFPSTANTPLTTTKFTPIRGAEGSDHQ